MSTFDAAQGRRDGNATGGADDCACDPLTAVLDRSALLRGNRCLACRVCCRFPSAGSPLAPFFSHDEISRAHAAGLAADAFPPARFGPGHSPFLVSEPEFHRCPAFRVPTNDCALYRVRPLDCRLYPLLLTYSSDGAQVLLGLDSYCPAVAETADTPAAHRLLEEAAALLEGPLLPQVVESRGIVGAWKDHLLHARPLPRLGRLLCRSDLGLARFTPTARAALEPFFNAHRGELSYHAFASVHAWSDFFDLRWKVCGDRLLLFAQGDGDAFLMTPPLGRGDPRPAAREALELLRALDPAAPSPRIQESDDATVRSLTADGWRVRESAPEYLYDRAELADLRGNRFAGKRQPCNRFEREHDWRWRPLEPEDLSAAAGLHRRWLERRLATEPDEVFRAQAEASLRAAWRSLRDADATGLVARALDADGRLAGFTAGCPLHDGRTFAVLYEIADLDIPGAAQAMFRAFCRELAPFAFINAGSDSGLQALARVKESYHPLRRPLAHVLVPG